MNNFRKTLVTTLIILMLTGTIVQAAMAAEITTSKLTYYYPNDQTAEISGTGFLASAPITIAINIVEVGTQFTDTITSNADGTFTYNYQLDGTPYTYEVTATDGTNTATTTFYDPSASLTPVSGVAGTSLSITGQGFVHSGTYYIKFDGTQIASGGTKSNGQISASIDTPTTASVGPHTVTVTDSATTPNTINLTFEVTSLTLNPTHNVASTTVTMSGAGFHASTTSPPVNTYSISATFDGSALTLTGTTTLDSTGTFSGVTFTVPSTATPGTHKVVVTDNFASPPSNAYSASATFTVDAPPSDTTPPVITHEISGTLGDNGWYTSDVTVTFTATDDQSTITAQGLTSPVTSTENSYTVSSDTDSAGVTITYSATSSGGTATDSVTIKRDATAPTLNMPTLPTNVFIGQEVTGTWTASDPTPGSGLVGSSSGTITVDTSDFGLKTGTITVKDNAGNSVTKEWSCYVAYKFTGFLQPINNDGTSIFKQKSTIPVKFQVTDETGAYVDSIIANIQVRLIANGVPGTVNEAIDSTSAATSGSLFRYDPTSGNYIFNLGTKGYTAGCQYQITAITTGGFSYSVIVGLK